MTDRKAEKEIRLQALKDRTKEILDAHGIELHIGGCGCCGSPSVSMRYQGEVIFGEENDFNFDNYNYRD